MLRAIEQIDINLYPDSFSFVRQQINHMIIVEDLFRCRLTGDPAPHQSTNTKLVPELNQLDDRLMDSNNWYCDFVSELEDRQKQIAFTFADGKRGMMTIQEILFHIVTHGSYHRGNIAHALDLASIPHPADGYGIYIHEQEPERREIK